MKEKLKHWIFPALIFIAAFFDSYLDLIQEVIEYFKLGHGWVIFTRVVAAALVVWRLKQSMPTESKLERKGFIKKEDCADLPTK